MAVQSLYRRYRPRRFSELRGQDHVVRALRNAVINEREGQAYLFSGPRGTGKTSTARILAKVLNCETPVEGEPCCTCPSCVAVEAGTSYDVIELDAASNNGVDDIRELIDHAALGNPGRHRVFILDEVHMLSKGAEAALLKTLEEPPSHVVFVLATTDPQKVSETIRSRTQHLQFHLLPMHDLEEHVKFVIADAGLSVTPEAIAQVLVQGGGSARDTLSALELVAASGGEADHSVNLDEFIEAIIENDPARALAAVAFAVQQGRDPRSLSEELIRYLRDGFLSQMAPELVQLPAERIDYVAQWAQRMGNAAIVRSMEVLGDMLVEMRRAPDARLLFEVAMVRISHVAESGDSSALLARIERLEKLVERGAVVTAQAAPTPPPVDPTTGRAKLGGAVRQSTGNTGPIARPQTPSAPPATVVTATPTPAKPVGTVGEMWPSVLASLKPLVRALYSPCVVGVSSVDAVTLNAPNTVHKERCADHLVVVVGAYEAAMGVAITVSLGVSEGTAKDPTDRLSKARKPVPETDEVPHDNIDPNELIDAPLVSVVSPLDQITKAFPGTRVVNEGKNK
ncbi:MAG: DNA polymerase III subunit gamma/tau [bacterium]